LLRELSIFDEVVLNTLPHRLWRLIPPRVVALVLKREAILLFRLLRRRYKVDEQMGLARGQLVVVEEGLGAEGLDHI